MARYFPCWMSIATVNAMGHLLGYARVSTTDQDAALQIDALTAAGCYRVFVDSLLQIQPLAEGEVARLRSELAPGAGTNSLLGSASELVSAKGKRL